MWAELRSCSLLFIFYCCICVTRISLSVTLISFRQSAINSLCHLPRQRAHWCFYRLVAFAKQLLLLLPLFVCRYYGRLRVLLLIRFQCHCFIANTVSVVVVIVATTCAFVLLTTCSRLCSAICCDALLFSQLLHCFPCAPWLLSGVASRVQLATTAGCTDASCKNTDNPWTSYCHRSGCTSAHDIADLWNFVFLLASFRCCVFTISI